MTAYRSGAAFRRALEDRLLNQSSQTAMPLVRLRKLVAFDRFLARLLLAQPGLWMLKGGLALQLRMGDLARTTKDVDVLLRIPATEVQHALQTAALLDLDDWFTFTLRSATGPLPGPDEGGIRFFVTARVDGRVFESFHLDVGSGDPVIESAENFTTPPLLAFAGIPPVTIPCYPLTQHLAEKVHAYVRPRATGESTRVKDLVDILLAAGHMQVRGSALMAAIHATFAAQGDTEVPLTLPAPPEGWATAFKRLAAEVGLPQTTLSDAFAAACRFLDPVLNGSVAGTWSPTDQAWTDDLSPDDGADNANLSAPLRPLPGL